MKESIALVTHKDLSLYCAETETLSNVFSDLLQACFPWGRNPDSWSTSSYKEFSHLEDSLFASVGEVPWDPRPMNERKDIKKMLKEKRKDYEEFLEYNKKVRRAYFSDLGASDSSSWFHQNLEAMIPRKKT